MIGSMIGSNDWSAVLGKATETGMGDIGCSSMCQPLSVSLSIKWLCQDQGACTRVAALISLLALFLWTSEHSAGSIIPDCIAGVSPTPKPNRCAN